MVSKINIGDVFGRLTVVEKTSLRKRGAVVWRCQCSCGNFTETKTDYLQQGWTKSCGCWKSQRAKERLPEVWAVNPKKNQNKTVYKFNSLLTHYRENAKSRLLDFNLSEKETYDIVTKECFYCGYIPVPETTSSNQKYTDHYNGIDRVNPKLGYTIENVVSCCRSCNIAKHTMSQCDYDAWIERSYSKLQKRKK